MIASFNFYFTLAVFRIFDGLFKIMTLDNDYKKTGIYSTIMGKKSGLKSSCVNCGSPLELGSTYCPRCGYHQRPKMGSESEGPAPPYSRPQRSPAIAVALAFLIPGAGHMYAGEWTTGIVFLFVALLAAASTVLLVGFLLYPIVWILGMIGGARAVERFNFPDRF